MSDRPGYKRDMIEHFLIVVKQLMSTPETRCTGMNAADERGERCEWFSPRAVAFGIQGAIWLATAGTQDEGQRNTDREWLRRVLGELVPEGEGLVQFTDRLSHEQLMRMLDKTIEELP